MNSDLVLINHLASASWQNGLPPTGDSQDKGELERLKKIAELAARAIKNDEMRNAAEKVIIHCWDFAVRLSHPATAFLACKICRDHFPNIGGSHLIPSTAIEISFGKEKIKLPGFYKSLLANASPYFKALFEAGFSEKQNGLFKIDDISPRFFEILLSLAFEGKLPEQGLTIDDLVHLLQAVDRLQLKSAEQPLIDAAKESIARLKQKPEHYQAALSIHGASWKLSPEANLELQKELLKYFACATLPLKTFDSLLNYVKRFGKDLPSLSVSKQNISDEQLGTLLGYCPNLSSLSTGCVSDPGLEAIKKLKNLVIFEVGDATSLTVEGLKAVAELKSLARLLIWKCWKLTDSALELIQRLGGLIELDISFSPALTGEGFQYLSGLKRLTTLSVSLSPNLSDSGLRHLQSIPQLRKLHISDNSQLTNKALEHLSKLESLKELDIRFSTIRNEAVEKLKAQIDKGLKIL